MIRRTIVLVLGILLLALGAKGTFTGLAAAPEGSTPSETDYLDTSVPVPNNYGPWVPPLPAIGTFNVGGPDTRTQVTDTTVVPFNRIALLEIDFDGDGIYETGCTGELVGPRLVLTAGQCVYDPVTGMSAHSIIVTPGENGASTFPFGYQIVSSSALTTTNGWISDDPNYDRGEITLPDQTLYNQVGAFTLAVADDAVLGGTTVNVAGYPGDKPYGTQWTASGTVTALTSTMISYNADAAAGESGGPVWLYDGTNRYPVGVHTRGVGSPYCAASSNCGTRITASAASDLESLGANPHVNLTGSTPTPSPTPTPVVTPTPTPVGTSRIWGDEDCGGDIAPRDAQAILKNVLVQSALSQTQPCPAVGAQVTVDGVSRIWGDIDCSGDIAPRDAQAILKNVLVQDPLSQTQPCPAVGSTVQVVG